MSSPSKNRASRAEYVSQNQLKLPGFETPFEQNLNPNNRWVRLSNLIPWDELCLIYRQKNVVSERGRPDINPRVVLGSIIIKHMCNLDDRETVDQITENVYMQHFLGFSSFSTEAPFDASMFVEFRRRLGLEQINAMNDLISKIKQKLDKKEESEKEYKDSDDQSGRQNQEGPTHKGELLMDATVCPQDISFPTDLDLLNEAREKSEELIDFLFSKTTSANKPRTYRENARKDYLKTAQRKKKTLKIVRIANKKQLNYLRRNLRHIEAILDELGYIPFNAKQYKYWFVIQHLYSQQRYMFKNKTHSVEHRIVSIHQPHVRPMVRGKASANTEFGAKINVSLVEGITFLDDFSWEAFNEGTRLRQSVENYKHRFGYYPKSVLADKIYCNRDNRNYLKMLNIELKAKPLGRPPKTALSSQVSPGERNPIEGKFGQAKTGYGMNCIKARLATTSESWIGSIILVLNLVKLAEVALLWKITFRKIISFIILMKNIFMYSILQTKIA